MQDDLYQEIILDHNQHPRNFGSLKDANTKGEGLNSLCGDEITVELIMHNNVIQDISFSGGGCAITKASASIMTTLVKDKTKEEALALFDHFHRILTEGCPMKCHNVDKLCVFQSVRKYPLRVKCATLPWHALKDALNNKKHE